MKRRDAAKILGITAGLAAGGCVQQSAEKVIPYLNQPDDIVPGIPTWYATTCRECPAGCGMLAKVLDGRPVKLEGNPEHPINKGALCARGQAAIQGLYHPDRFRGPMERKNGKLVPISWDEALGKLAQTISSIVQKNKTDGIQLVTGAITGSLSDLVDKWLAGLGAQKKMIYEPLGRDAQRAANKAAYGVPEIPALRIDNAEFILGFGADFLETGPSPIEHARQLADVKERWGESVGRARFIALDSRLSLTAANADEWVPIKPGTEVLIALAVLNVVRRKKGDNTYKDFTPTFVAPKTGLSAAKIESLISQFTSVWPTLAVAGQTCANAGALWRFVNALNFGNWPGTELPGTGTGADWAFYSEMKDLADRMASKEIELLFVGGVNPAFTLPKSARFAEASQKVPLIVSFASMPDETTETARLILPTHHFLESWGDYSPRYGITGLVQPTRRPMYDTRSLKEILVELTRKTSGESMTALAADLARDNNEQFWQTKSSSASIWQDTWIQVRRKGGVWDKPTYERVTLSGFPPAPKIGELIPSENLTLQVFPSSLNYDGRGADMPWLNDCPDPMSKVAGEAWVEVHPDTAKKIGVVTGSVIKVKTEAGSGEWPVWVTEGLHPGAIAIPTGTRNSRDGAFASNVMDLLPAEPDISGTVRWTADVEIAPAGSHHDLAYLQGSDSQHGRGMARDTGYIARDKARKEWVVRNRVNEPKRKDMYPPYEHPEYRWGMAIDLDRCTGCSACVVACYAENNLPVVGHKQLLMRREMAWIRVERYYESSESGKSAIFTPMLCQHCGNAPCESVCPVYASYHTPEGLNAQVYNRCVGTQYCSNNCPYKVRRFNWYMYRWQEPLNLQLNPDVTVREKGVMEKCTFCVQRIIAAKMTAKREDRNLKDGDIVPACAQTCPTNAIIFGNLKDPNSRVIAHSESLRGYHVLGDLNTKPAITYLKRISRKA